MSISEIKIEKNEELIVNIEKDGNEKVSVIVEHLDRLANYILTTCKIEFKTGEYDKEVLLRLGEEYLQICKTINQFKEKGFENNDILITCDYNKIKRMIDSIN